MSVVEQQIKEYDSLLDLLEDLDREGITGFQRREAYTRFLNLRARMKGSVYSGGFELTPLCNFDCKMCYVHLNGSQMAKPLLTTEQWIGIIQQAIDAGMMHADLTGGECLTHPGFREIYAYLRTHGVEVSVLTNGQLVTGEIADLFAQYPPATVQITVYGSNEDAYEAVTGHRAFADVYATIERLKKRGIRMFLPITPNRFMQEDTHELLEFLRNTGVRYAIGTGSLPAREETGRTLDYYAPDDALYVRLHKDEQAYQKALPKENAIPLQGRKIDRVPRGFKGISSIPCSSGQCSFHINWKGEMQPCIPFHTVTRSVLEHGFDVCWAWIKERMAAYQLPQECLDCEYAQACVSCPAERTMGVLNGPVNKAVCSRYACYVREGIAHLPQEETCK